VHRLSKHQFWFVKRQDLRMVIEYFESYAGKWVTGFEKAAYRGG